MWRLDNGARTYLLPSADSVWGYSHVSFRNTARPGWVYVSHYNPPSANPGSDQVVAVKTDGSGTVEVFASAHHAATSYESQPQAVPNRDGTRVLFASEWAGSAGPIYAYVAGNY